MPGDMFGATLAEGWWCTNCEYYENDDEINTEMETCICCGCAGADHKRAEVVAK